MFFNHVLHGAFGELDVSTTAISAKWKAETQESHVVVKISISRITTGKKLQKYKSINLTTCVELILEFKAFAI